MKRLLATIVGLSCIWAQSRGQQVVSLTVDQAITPVTADYIARGIGEAGRMNAACVVIHLNTPGGQLTSTRKIVGDILDAPVPVVVYIAPSGARAGSAGVFITLAANIAAMAPGTNIGASHPVTMIGKMDSTMTEKVTNDASAFIRSIAEKRHKNVAWAEDAVRHSVSITETEALEKNVIDLISASTPELLRKIDGDTVVTAAGPRVLHTAEATVTTVSMGLGEKMLVFFSDPNLMYILLLVGIFGILFEFYNPGAIFPGIIGVICLVVSFYAMSVLPINYAGLGLILFAVILFLLELKITSHGILAIGGIVSLLIGSLMLVRTGPATDYVMISRIVIFTSVVLSTLFFLFIIGMGLKAQRARPFSGVEGFTGEEGVALTALAPAGKVRVHGEIWNAESVSGAVDAGEKVRVKRLEGLRVYVEAAREPERD